MNTRRRVSDCTAARRTMELLGMTLHNLAMSVSDVNPGDVDAQAHRRDIEEMRVHIDTLSKFLDALSPLVQPVQVFQKRTGEQPEQRLGPIIGLDGKHPRRVDPELPERIRALREAGWTVPIAGIQEFRHRRRQGGFNIIDRGGSHPSIIPDK